MKQTRDSHRYMDCFMKRQYPEVASNFVASTFVSGRELAARMASPPRR